MGQTQAKSSKPAKKGKKSQQDSDDDDNEEIETVVNEACPFIKVHILLELPSGTTEKREFDIDTSKTAKQVKRDLETLLKIKEGNIKVYHHNGTKEMPNNPQIRNLQIEDGSILRVRDASLKY